MEGKIVSIAMVSILLIPLFLITTAEAKTEIRFSGWNVGAGELALYQQMFEEFEKSYPQYKVVYEPIVEQYPQKMLMMMRSGTAPDVFYVDSSYAQQWIKSGNLLPLDDFLDAEDRKDFIPAFLDLFTVNESLYAIPKDFSVLGLFYNREIFEKANTTPPETWDELLLAARKIKDELNVLPLCMSPDLARWLAFVYQKNTTIVSNNKTNFDDPEVVEALDFYAGFQRESLSKLPGELGESWPGDAFAKEKCAMVIEGNWLVPFLKDNYPGVYNKTGVAPLPYPEDGKKATLAFTVGLAVYKNSKNPEAAWTLIDFLTSKGGQKRLVIEMGQTMPTRISLANDKNMLPLHRELMKEYDNAIPWALGAINLSELQSRINPEIEATMRGAKSAEQACSDMKRVGDEILRYSA